MMSPLQAVRVIVALSLALGASSCAFTTTDVYRPLVVAEFPPPEDFDEIRTTYFPEADNLRFAESLRLTRAAWDYFDIQKYQSFYADLDIQRLADALAAYDENPFAWTQLGAYLALQHRPEAAALATLHALDVLDRLGDLTESAELTELKQVSRINLAIYHNTAGRPQAALAALDRAGEPEGLPPFHRLAYYWAAAQAHTALLDVKSSRTALEEARAVADQGLGTYGAWADYPQYFKPSKREALFRYLEASNLRIEGRYGEAIDRLDEAIDGPKGVADPKLWDARFLRALAYKESGNLDRAAYDLERLAVQVPGKLFRREAILYYLALVRIERQELIEARDALARSVEIVRADNRRLGKALEDTLASDGLPLAVSEVLGAAHTDEGWVFSPAFEALGEAYLDALAHRSPGRDNPLWVDEAERMFQVALGERGFPDDTRGRAPDAMVIEAVATEDRTGFPQTSIVPDWTLAHRFYSSLVPGTARYTRRHVAHSRLAHLYWQRGDHDLALERFAETLAASPRDAPTLMSLVELGSRAPNDEAARSAYDLVLRYLPVEAAPFGVEEAVGPGLDSLLADPPGAAGSEELAHLRARLLLLRGELDAAAEAFRRAGEAHPGALWPATGGAWVDLNRDPPGDPETTGRLDRALVAVGPATLRWQRRDAHFVRGQIRLLTGDAQGALEDFEAVTTLQQGWSLAEEGVLLAESMGGFRGKAAGS